MLREEFENRMGNTVTPEAYEDIQDLYIAAGDIDKDTFCDDYKLHGSSKILAGLWKRYKSKTNALNIYMREHKEAATLLIRIADETGNKMAYDCAQMMLGDSGIVRYKIEQGLPLTNAEREYIISKL